MPHSHEVTVKFMWSSNRWTKSDPLDQAIGYAICRFNPMRTLWFMLLLYIPHVGGASLCENFVREHAWDTRIDVLTRAAIYPNGAKERAKELLRNGPWHTEKDRATGDRIERGEYFPEIALSVHQLPPFQTRTASFLERADYAEVPLISLTGPAFELRDPALIKRSQLILGSFEGEFNLPLNTSKIHLFGGRCNACMKLATRIAIQRAFESPERRELNLVLHTELIYFNYSGSTTSIQALPSTKDPIYLLRTRTHKEIIDSIVSTIGTESDRFGAMVTSRNQNMEFVVESTDPGSNSARLLFRPIGEEKKHLNIEFRTTW